MLEVLCSEREKRERKREGGEMLRVEEGEREVICMEGYKEALGVGVE